MEEWEGMLQDPGTSNGWKSLFKKTLQQYWIMKHVVAMEEWEGMLQDPGTSNGWQSLFKKTLQHY